MHIPFYRNIGARDLLDIFFISAVSTVLLTRFYLHITGYPQIGGGSLHIAHMLYGGILMLVALVLVFAFLGNRSRQSAALIGGIGFGLFIDELGKFITKDNDYFYQPTIGLIYAVFVILYLGFNFLTRRQRLSSREYQINALNELEEAIAQDLDKEERQQIYSLLNQADQKSAVTKHLKKFIDTIPISAPDKPSRITQFLKYIDNAYIHFWHNRNSNYLVRAIFTAEIIILTSGVIYTVYTNIEELRAFFNDPGLTYGRELILGQVGFSLIAAGFVIYGLMQFKRSRFDAFEQFRRATLINIYLTQFFVFVRIEFGALPGFLLNLALLLVISFVLRQEKRLGGASHVN